MFASKRKTESPCKIFGHSPLLDSIVAELYIVPMYDLAIFTTIVCLLANVFLLGWVYCVLLTVFPGRMVG
jgi:hypothetical protein